MQRENMHSSELIAQSDRSSREAIANMQVSSNDRERIASYLAAMENSYAGLFNGIQNNQNIPAETRQEYLSHAAAIRNSTLAMAQQVYGAAAQGVSWASPRV